MWPSGWKRLDHPDLCHDSRVGHVLQPGSQDVTLPSGLALSCFFFFPFFFSPSRGFRGECLHSSVVVSTGVCDCLVLSCSFSGSDRFQYTVALPFHKPLVLLLAFAADSFESKIFLLVFDNPYRRGCPLGRVSSYWGSVRSFLSCWQHNLLSWCCLLSHLASFYRLVTGGRLRFLSPQLSLRVSWGRSRLGGRGFLAPAERVRPQVGF